MNSFYIKTEIRSKYRTSLDVDRLLILRLQNKSTEEATIAINIGGKPSVNAISVSPGKSVMEYLDLIVRKQSIELVLKEGSAIIAELICI